MPMKYTGVTETAQRWGLTDRRVRALLKAGKIKGAKKDGRIWMIPEDAQKPVDGRFAVKAPALYLKWENTVIGEIDDDFNVHFVAPEYNSVVAAYTKGKDSWSREEFEDFLSDRIVSAGRRDIEQILFRLGFSRYKLTEVAVTTHAINSSDLIWIAYNKNDRLQDVLSEVFKSVFGRKVDLQGNSVDTPEGYNIKRYGVYNGRYGIFKARIHPLSTDVESEIAVYKIAQLIGVPCCPAYRAGEDTVFSEFVYDISKEYIVHFRRFFEFGRSDDEYMNLLSVRPRYQKDFIKMLVLDFLTRQDDRHLSNIAVKISENTESFYPLYDNGRSLFYEDSRDTVEKAPSDVRKFCTGFGPVGTYYDTLKRISDDGVVFSKLVKLDFTGNQIKKILKDSGFKDYRLDGAVNWIMAAAKELKKLDE